MIACSGQKKKIPNIIITVHHSIYSNQPDQLRTENNTFQHLLNHIKINRFEEETDIVLEETFPGDPLKQNPFIYNAFLIQHSFT